MVLIRHLPADSAYVSSRQEDPWDTTHHLLAGIFDAIQNGNWQFATANSKRRIRKPKPLPRPADRPERIGGKAMPLDELKRRLEQVGKGDQP